MAIFIFNLFLIVVGNWANSFTISIRINIFIVLIDFKMIHLIIIETQS